MRKKCCTRAKAQVQKVRKKKRSNDGKMNAGLDESESEWDGAKINTGWRTGAGSRLSGFNPSSVVACMRTCWWRCAISQPRWLLRESRINKRRWVGSQRRGTDAPNARDEAHNKALHSLNWSAREEPRRCDSHVSPGKSTECGESCAKKIVIL